MKEFLTDPAVQTAFWAFVGALSALGLPKLFGWLKALAGKTKTTLDDELVAKIEELVESAVKKKTGGDKQHGA